MIESIVVNYKIIVYNLWKWQSWITVVDVLSHKVEECGPYERTIIMLKI
jgi:hypothetical protein